MFGLQRKAESWSFLKVSIKDSAIGAHWDSGFRPAESGHWLLLGSRRKRMRAFYPVPLLNRLYGWL